MINIRFFTLVSFFLTATTANATLIFSEYIEGSSYNKALELYNLGETVNLDSGNYSLEIYSNGASSSSYSINLTGTIFQNSSYVIAHTRSNETIQSASDQLSGSLNFNGDDAIALLHNGLIIDIIGQVGVDPGSEWGSGLTSTQDNTLRRLPDILLGDDDAFDSYDPALQWVGFAQDNVDGLGQHLINLPSSDDNQVASVPEPATLWLLLLGMLGFFKPGRPVHFQPNFS